MQRKKLASMQHCEPSQRQRHPGATRTAMLPASLPFPNLRVESLGIRVKHTHITPKKRNLQTLQTGVQRSCLLTCECTCGKNASEKHRMNIAHKQPKTSTQPQTWHRKRKKCFRCILYAEERCQNTRKGKLCRIMKGKNGKPEQWY